MDSAKTVARSLGDVITLAVLVAITLISISVLAGWYFHARLLIQVIPGTIAMQYNTALCFIVLAACSLALILRRGHRLLLVAKALAGDAKKERAIVENALDVICSVDAEGKFVKINPACFKLW